MLLPWLHGTTSCIRPSWGGRGWSEEIIPLSVLLDLNSFTLSVGTPFGADRREPKHGDLQQRYFSVSFFFLVLLLV